MHNNSSSNSTKMNFENDKLTKDILELKHENLSLIYDMLKSKNISFCENCIELMRNASENEKKCMLRKLEQAKLIEEIIDLNESIRSYMIVMKKIGYMITVREVSNIWYLLNLFLQ